MQSVMTPQQLFNQVSRPDIQRSSFDRSHGIKTTFKAGQLIPFFVDEAVPGDTFDIDAKLFGRLLSPLSTPLMDNMFLDIHWFSVPNRLLWNNFKRFMGEQDTKDLLDNVDGTHILPTMKSNNTTGYAEESLFDYMGLPTKIPDLHHRADFIRAYSLIWNEWYRDQNLQDKVVINSGDGDDSITNTNILPRGKRKDYFTSALPFAQKAQPVSIPLGGTVPIVSNNLPIQLKNFDMGVKTSTLWSSSTKGIYGPSLGQDSTSDITFSGSDTGLEGDLSTSTTVTINALREAFQIQKMYERDARGGTRYTEINYSHFGVTSPDARLQRPEYLGGSTSNINTQTISQTSASEAGSTPQGTLTAFAQFNSSPNRFVKSFTEHEIVIGLVSIRADINYQQGIDRMWNRSTRFDFYFPSFAHLGEQAILNKEIYAQGKSIKDIDENIIDDKVFGYQERFAEMRYKRSSITGLFRSNCTQPLDSWHLAEEFENLPVLNQHFITENPPIERVVAVTTGSHFLCDGFINFKATRPMPTFAIPGMIDHF